MRIRKLLAAAGVAAAVATTGLATADTASAINYDCSGETHAVCLYFNSSAYGYGAYFQQSGDIHDYGAYWFQPGLNGSNGVGNTVKNHAAAVDSWYGGNFVVYYNSWYDCRYACQTIPAWKTVDLNSTLKNNNASGAFH